jgi:phosphoribosylaminoimidazolecarboxamide formyltransferase/IMP cyclohydrolase
VIDMADRVPIRRALLSVSDKSGLVDFAAALHRWGAEIVSTGGTAATLRGAGLPCLDVQQVTGFPEMMDGRVKTLHPAVHGALLARRDQPDHVDALRRHDFTPIDLVGVNLYPFEDTIRRPGATRAEAIEQIDIGGPAMIRSAAKNHAFVAVVTSPSQYQSIVSAMKADNGCTTASLRAALAQEAFARTAAYDSAIANYLAQSPHETDDRFPRALQLRYELRSVLRYGENPHQRAALYRDPASREHGLVMADILHGKELSYNNIQDAAAALTLARELHALRPDAAAAVIVKHANPCGAACSHDLPSAFARAYTGDPRAAYGGILALSRPVDQSTAILIAEGDRFLEVIVAPSYEADALATLRGRWKNVRLLATGPFGAATSESMSYRSLEGGMLVQEHDARPADPATWIHAAGPPPACGLMDDAAFTWTIVKHLKSNAIAIGEGGRLLGAGPGQVDRVTSCRVAVEKAGFRLPRNSVAASDAFFPFPDGPKLLVDAGAGCLIHPGGSKRDQETFDLCNARGVTCLLTGIRHFLH